MDFGSAAKLGSYLSRDYAEAFFEMLANYRDISASEAASQLGLHINTAQEFLEAMAAFDIVEKTEVAEGKRPYYRYSLKTDRILIDLDLKSMRRVQAADSQSRKIREAASANVRFTTARDGRSISSIALWTGRGRNRKERRISLTPVQGLFLYHLPFPDGTPLTERDIMGRADIEESRQAEIADIIELMIVYKVIEVFT